jgi:pre-mRNA-splicing factor ATP-dependent RNA helicase DHX16
MGLGPTPPAPPHTHPPTPSPHRTEYSYKKKILVLFPLLFPFFFVFPRHKKDREREREKERGKEKEREKERERKREREREGRGNNTQRERKCVREKGMSLRSWVSDELHHVLEYADTHVVDYIVAMAKAATSSDGLLAALEAEGIADTAVSRRFAKELMDRVGRMGQRDSSVQAETKRAVAARKRNDSYSLLLPSLPDDPTESEKPGSREKEKETERKKKDVAKQLRKRRREDVESNWKDEDGDRGEGAKGRGGGEKKKEGSGEEEREDEAEREGGRGAGDEEEEEEDDRDRDVREAREIAEFEERLHDRNKQRVKKVGYGAQEAMHKAKRRREMEREEQAKLVPHLRKISRLKYFEKREPQQLRALEERIHDELFLFEGEELTREEILRRQYDEKALTLVKETKQAQKIMDDVIHSSYKVPQGEYTSDGKIDRDKKMELLSRYTKEEEGPPVSEQMIWEDLQLSAAKSTFYNEQKAHAAKLQQQQLLQKQQRKSSQHRDGDEDVRKSSDATSVDVEKPTAEEDSSAAEYDLLFENEIEFVASEILAGSNTQKEEVSKMSVKEIQQENMKQTRMSLPIYLYRELLLDAIHDHQVLVVVGETGSG